jgi:hypothetical protein
VMHLAAKQQKSCAPNANRPKKKPDRNFESGVPAAERREFLKTTDDSLSAIVLISIVVTAS